MLNLKSRGRPPVLVAALLASLIAASTAVPGRAAAPKSGVLNFTNYEVTDPNFGGMRVATIAIPAGWRASSQVRWDFGSANYPVHVHVRVQSPDGKMWIDLLPMDAVYWMDRVFTPIPVGQRSFGAVYAPNASIEQAMQQLVVLPARGKMPGFQITAKRPVDAARLAQAFNRVNWRGEAMSMRVRYTLNGTPVEEDFFTFYTAVRRSRTPARKARATSSTAC